jgi:hypothetical protein
VICGQDTAVTFVINLEGGNDIVTAGFAFNAPLPHRPTVINGGTGNDRLSGGSVDDAIDGGPGDDEILVTGGGGTANGGPGDDRFESGAGPVQAPVQIHGGDGRDVLLLHGRGEVTLDGSMNDVNGMNVMPDVEDIEGSDSVDRLTGSAAGNRLRGRFGEDVLVGAGGPDSLDGGPDTDAILASDGEIDSVVCGGGIDHVLADWNDAVHDDCELVTRAARSDDGQQARLKHNGARVVTNWLAFARHTRVDVLRLRDIPVGGRATLRCTGRGCPFRKAKRLRIRDGRANATGLFEGKRLRPGAVIAIRVTAPGTMGKIVRYTMRSRRPPAKQTLCDPPGQSRPGRC